MNGNRRSPIHCPLPASPRRGVVLLVVLALLAIFGLFAVAFLMISGQAQRGARSIERIEQGAAASPLEARSLLRQAALQVLRGPNTDSAGRSPNPTSAMGAHSLLETMYGNGWVGGTVTVAAAAGGAGVPFPQLIDMTVTGISAAELARRGGCVLTVTGVPTTGTVAEKALVGQSTRIVGGNSTAGTIQVMAFADAATLPPTNSTFIINGVPFSGTGFGYNAAAGNLDATKTIPDVASPCHVALLPNLPLSFYYNAMTNPLSNPPGGANTDYTAPDFQHMLLAAQVPNTNAPGGIQTLPSMHRAALCRYWAKQTVTSITPNFNTVADPDGLPAIARAMAIDMKRAITMRPLPDDHPNFTGSNPSYNAAAAPNQYASGFNPLWDGQSTYSQTPAPFSWDVDNDGDGVPDSVWVDLGMPVRSTADGRLYKPLFAILCVDLDGRLNLNAHGSLAQTAAAYAQQV
ncbi:MAG: hypothetical protein LLG00_07495, partial [Planctomycetaceae bacterium]|nr:hypothetical protein [Planctomycetaceae bacterium]